MPDYNHIPAAIEAMERAAKQIVVKGALDVEAAAKQLAAVDTGFMRSAIYTVTADGSSYGQGAGGEHLEPELSEGTDDGQTAWVVAGADYSIYVEMGTRFMPAQPYFAPSVDRYAATFESVMGQLESAIQAAMGGL